MRRKTLAILLPIPFAALPILVVLAGALFGGKGTDSGNLLTTREQTPALEERVSNETLPAADNGTLARVNTQDHERDCGEDLSADF